MTTLSEAASVAIIHEAGSTYRNMILGLTRDGGFAEAQKIMDFATTVTKNYITVVLAELDINP